MSKDSSVFTFQNAAVSGSWVDKRRSSWYSGWPMKEHFLKAAFI